MTNPQLSRLRTNRLSLQTSSPPISPAEKENGRCASASSGGGGGGGDGGGGHSSASSPRQCDVGSGGLSPASLQEIQTELKAVLSSLDQFSFGEHASLPGAPFTDNNLHNVRPSDTTKPDLVRSLPYTKMPSVDRSMRAGSETKEVPPKPPKPAHKWSASMTCSTPSAFEVRKF